MYFMAGRESNLPLPPVIFLERDTLKANRKQGLATISQSPATRDSQVHTSERAWRSPGPWQSHSSGQRAQGDFSKLICKEHPVSNVISLQILHKPLTHPAARGKERLPQTVHFHFYLVCLSYSAPVAAKEYWLSEILQNERAGSHLQLQTRAQLVLY